MRSGKRQSDPHIDNYTNAPPYYLKFPVPGPHFIIVVTSCFLEEAVFIVQIGHKTKIERSIHSCFTFMGKQVIQRLKMSSILRLLAVVSVNIAIVSCSNGTTANIETIFLGRCYDYVQLKSNGKSFGSKNCSSLYNTFADAFTKNTTCSTDYSSIFERFFKQIDPGPTPKDKVMFHFQCQYFDGRVC